MKKLTLSQGRRQKEEVNQDPKIKRTLKNFDDDDNGLLIETECKADCNIFLKTKRLVQEPTQRNFSRCYALLWMKKKFNRARS